MAISYLSARSNMGQPEKNTSVEALERTSWPVDMSVRGWFVCYWIGRPQPLAMAAPFSALKVLNHVRQETNR